MSRKCQRIRFLICARMSSHVLKTRKIMICKCIFPHFHPDVFSMVYISHRSNGWRTVWGFGIDTDPSSFLIQCRQHCWLKSFKVNFSKAKAKWWCRINEMNRLHPFSLVDTNSAMAELMQSDLLLTLSIFFLLRENPQRKCK